MLEKKNTFSSIRQMLEEKKLFFCFLNTKRIRNECRRWGRSRELTAVNFREKEKEVACHCWFIFVIVVVVVFVFVFIAVVVVVVVFCGCHWKTGGVVGDMCNKMALFQSLRLLLIRFNPSPVFWGNFSICYQRCWTQFLAQSQEQMALLPMTHEYDHR